MLTLIVRSGLTFNINIDMSKILDTAHTGIRFIANQKNPSLDRSRVIDPKKPDVVVDVNAIVTVIGTQVWGRVYRIHARLENGGGNSPAITSHLELFRKALMSQFVASEPDFREKLSIASLTVVDQFGEHNYAVNQHSLIEPTLKVVTEEVAQRKLHNGG